MAKTAPTKLLVSYAPVVSPKKQPAVLLPITYHRADIRPATTIVTNLPPVIIMQEQPPSMVTTQLLFDSNDPILDPLNTSGELQEYVVEDVKDYSVNIKHGSTLEQRYNMLKGGEKPKNCRITDLEKDVNNLTKGMKNLVDERKDEKAKMHQWQLHSRAIEGMNLFLWITVLNQRQRDELRAKGIVNLEGLRCQLHHDGRARQIYGSIPQQYHAVSSDMAARRKKIYQERRDIAHPPITQRDFLAYLHASYPDLEHELKPIAQYQRHDNFTGAVENIFADDDEKVS